MTVLATAAIAAQRQADYRREAGTARLARLARLARAVQRCCRQALDCVPGRRR